MNWFKKMLFCMVMVAMLTPLAFADNSTTMFGSRIPGGMFAMNDLLNCQGEVFFVDSNTGTDGEGYGREPISPVDTIDYAIGLCEANKGDVILVFPQHAESVATAITCDVAGVTIIGLGYGNSLPPITATGAVDAMTVTAADVTIKNLIFAAP